MFYTAFNELNTEYMIDNRMYILLEPFQFFDISSN